MSQELAVFHGRPLGHVGSNGKFRCCPRKAIRTARVSDQTLDAVDEEGSGGRPTNAMVKRAASSRPTATSSTASSWVTPYSRNAG